MAHAGDPTASVPLLLVEIEGSVATVTLNRPSARNALNGQLLSELRSAMARLESDDGVRVVVLTGTDPAFCAGLDLKAISSGEKLLDTDLSSEAAIWRPWNPLGKPVIGAVNGAAITGGLELALNCDFLLASDRAVFADTHSRLGILAGWGMSVLLPERVGFAMARRMSLSGEPIDAETALRSGLVTEVVPHDDLLTATLRLASAIASNDHRGVAGWHSLYRHVETELIGRVLEIEQETNLAWRAGGGHDGIAERAPGVGRIPRTSPDPS